MTPHTFHIPVMGTGFTIDTPLRVAHLGLSSVMSLVDDHLIERVRRHHCRQRGLAFQAIGSREPDARARRITAWLDLVWDLVQQRMEEVRRLPFAPGNDKARYFELLPPRSPLQAGYRRLLALPAGAARDALAAELSAAMQPGEVEVNIMTKLDRLGTDAEGRPLPPEQSDAKAALRGVARSRMHGNLVLSAGVNPALYTVLEDCPSFHRDDEGRVQHGIVLKVSDLRSALIQGKFLAKKGVEVREFRVESGLNCGGHAFATEGELMGPILRELQEQRDGFPAVFEPLIEQALRARGRALHPSGRNRRIRVTAQGGVGTAGEAARLLEDYGCDSVGWATPFLLVPEVTAMDEGTRQALAQAGPQDLYLSSASPLGIPFHNLRRSSSERWHHERIAAGRPGSDCPNRYLTFDRELTGEPLCTASAAWQKVKLTQLGYATPPSEAEADPAAHAVYQKACICSHLANGALIEMGLVRPETPVAVCPGPNIAWFDRTYTLEEMVDHVYGRGPSLVPAHRPHMFAKELELYVDDYQRRAAEAADPRARRALAAYRAHLEEGLAHCLAVARGPAHPGENLASLAEAVERQSERLRAIDAALEEPAPVPAALLAAAVAPAPAPPPA